ncbi:hemolysin family protein [Aureliella helgolandensis]|uniref:Magnesium and cobalt efflux protein CorC n=1 Tax=Aureliella helgolandensis TaxID=2527968 RepID=A0A518G1Z8_9BACT|nr:hemolysin family protein [Aureliella helgolandensis]QDV22602.1 Magnesium and cobalt efflux protein CorC [Aureliella helgolandensis]
MISSLVPTVGPFRDHLNSCWRETLLFRLIFAFLGGMVVFGGLPDPALASDSPAPPTWTVAWLPQESPPVPVTEQLENAVADDGEEGSLSGSQADLAEDSSLPGAEVGEAASSSSESSEPSGQQVEAGQANSSLTAAGSAHEAVPESSGPPAWYLLLALVLLVANGFFVAAEFSLVKVRLSRIEQLVVSKRFFAKTARWTAQRLERSLSACQLGITMASLALGWVGEPAFASLLEPLLRFAGVTSPAVVHTVAFIVGFTAITALHLVVGEQAPKIFAIRQPEMMLLWCAVPLKIFYLLTYPLMAALNSATAWILKMVGLKDADGHEVPYTEEEIRALLSEAHIHGNLTRSEHKLLDAVFEFDDLICRRIMLPRGEVEFLDINASVAETMELIRRTKHTRYPVCDGSLDEVLGVLHVKDLIGRSLDESFKFQSIMRPPKKVPENMPISKLLRHFQGTHQLLALVLDEYGTVIGIVTLENVLEEIIGNVADEFDHEDPDVVPDGPGAFVIAGSASVQEVEHELKLSFGNVDVDTMAGLVMHFAERIVNAGDEIDLGVAKARVLEVADDRTTRLRIILPHDTEASLGDR